MVGGGEVREIRVGKYLVVKIPDEVVIAAENDPSGEEAKVIRELEQQVENLSDVAIEMANLVCSSASSIEDKVENTIKRLENYPCCMSCYLKREEMIAARDMKDNLIRILKEELL